jgi:hypothetical protein
MTTENKKWNIIHCKKLNVGSRWVNFDHPFIIEQAEKRGLNVIVIGERQDL